MPRLRFGLVVAFVTCLHHIAVTQVEAACTGNPSSTCDSTQCCYEDIPAVLGIGGDIVPDQSCYDTGTSIDYVCNGDLAGPPFNNCVGGAWSFGVGPTCTVGVQCPQPTVPTYGAISPDQTEYEKYTTITYSCNSGFTLTGPQRSTCESDGTWNPTTTPTCDVNCKPPTISNGEISPNKSSYVNGEVINYSCDTNYTLVGITSTTCRDGAFDPSSVPNCYGKCNPPVVANSNYDTQQGLVEHGTTIEIICDTQYSTGTGTETDLRCTDGNFDDDDPVCYANIDNGAEVVLECLSDIIRVKVPQSILPDLDGDVLSFEGYPSCTGEDEGEYLVFSAGFSDCGMTKMVDGDFDVYTNRIVNGASTGGLIYRDVTVSFPITCYYRRVHRIEYGYSVNGSAQLVQQSVVNNGDYDVTFNLALYTDDTFMTKVAQGEGVIWFNERAYFAVDIMPTDGRVVIESCWTTPSNMSEDPRRYDLITNGCDLEETVKWHDLGLSYKAAFSFSEFAFLASNEVFLYCKAAVCEDGNMAPECALCDQGRRRRGALNTALLQDVSVGPIRWDKEPNYQRQARGNTANEDSIFKQGDVRALKSVSVVMAITIVALLLVVILLIKKNRREANRV